MGIKTDIASAIPEVVAVKVEKDIDFHGQSATRVTAELENGKTVEGTFTDEPRGSFGGVQFSGPKDITALMIAKIISVLHGVTE